MPKGVPRVYSCPRHEFCVQALARSAHLAQIAHEHVRPGGLHVAPLALGEGLQPTGVVLQEQRQEA